MKKLITYLINFLQKQAKIEDKIEVKKGKLTNQLQYLKTVHRIVWRHHYAWPFHKPVDPVALKIPVSLYLYVYMYLIMGKPHVCLYSRFAINLIWVYSAGFTVVNDYVILKQYIQCNNNCENSIL